MVKRLTPLGIEKLHVSKRTEIADPECSGLYLRVTPRGRKSFYAIMKFDGVMKRMSLGPWPGVTLTDARGRVRDMREAGVPIAEITLEEVIERYIEFQRERGKRSWKIQKGQMKLHVIPVLGKKRPDQIRTSDLYALMETLDARGPAVAENVFSVLRPLFTWARRRNWATSNPAADVWPDVRKSQPRERVLTNPELRAIWAAASEMVEPVGDFVHVLMLTGQRRGETSRMRVDRITDGVWTIPGEDAKNGRQHTVPLSSTVQAIISPIKNRPYIFSTTGGDAPLGGFTQFKTRMDKLCGVKDWTYHDVRRTVTTRMAEMAIPDHVVDRILNHSVTRSTRAKHYDRYSYLREKTEAMEAWAQELGRIVNDNSAASEPALQLSLFDA